MSSCFTISLSLLFFFINFLGTESAPTFLRHYCPNTTLFTPNSTYQSNLNALLSSLSSAATDNADGFANAIAGQNPPDQVYGIFLCRGDVDAATCSNCVATGKQDILQRCPNRRVSVIWYDECMLRYSDESVYSVMEQVPSLTMYHTGNITYPTRFMQVLGETMETITARASVQKSGKKVAVAEANFTSLQKLYTLAQCTPDLVVSECNTCLRAAIAGLPQGKQGGRLFTPSCSMRFELYQFYNASAMAALLPPPNYLPSPPAPVTRRKALQSGTIYSITASSPLVQNQTLVSSSQIFELGFFTPNGSANQYVGIWYKSMAPSKVVWVANRDKPIGHTDQSGSLIIGEDGNLKLLDGQQNTVWSTNVMAKSNYSVAVLSDFGNLVLQDRNAIIMWESFDEPTDTLLPYMKIGVNVKTGKKRNLISWKGEDDPSFGRFVVGLTPETPPQLFTWNGSSPYWRGGQWDKTKFIGIPTMGGGGYHLQQDNDQGTSYYSLDNLNNSIFGYNFISFDGSLKAVHWANGWSPYWEAPAPINPCEIYGICGPFGVCNPFSSPICRCLKGFIPTSDEEWNRGNWTRGCLREMEFNCQESASRATSMTVEKDMFRKMEQMKLPDSADFLLIDDIEGCQSRCLENCSCLAFSYVNTIGCMAWSKALLDTQQFSMNGEDLFIRFAGAAAGAGAGAGSGVPTRTKLIISLSVISGIILFGAGISVSVLSKWRGKFRKMTIPRLFRSVAADIRSKEQLRETAWKEQMKEDDASKLVVYDFDSIRLATDNFDAKNKLGQGGFGPVYKGKLNDGKEIAAKRLLSSSGQGIAEFKNEILLISKLQHRNLVRLFGCCTEGEEMILVYEYLPNKSLDAFLFGLSHSSKNLFLLSTKFGTKTRYFFCLQHFLDSKEKGKLSWSVRFRVIQGVARGLLYLHCDSCLRVIHRDLKVSNILLDEKMNPKISDFGLARLFEDTQVLVNTHKIVGTLGYMSPEYAMGGTFSEKSDVYSFGVLLLEIISSKKSTSLDYPGQHLNLVAYAWHLWCEGRGLDLMDEAIADAFSMSEVMRCIQVGLLCTQDRATDRPDMLAVVLMLNGESNLPQPKQPAFTIESSPTQEVQSQERSIQSKNTITITTVEGR
ncbi:G-type lectin S-receptor-like serine/threonine-protein kinase At1g61370 isoform X3 [Syzygium oleosum]|uniref:G-type lectin S-receptor-like serine/threonine-protein kinase At1g61370 isoform X3 n=1 Tax=Syzygium oleosum TaxID=219896 RepID=UPI0024BB1795|nr:G-type lectin S-receptor-like serine/threonine-protein kinase At1g61370 isoform X3 [Syzygium oleosum]